MSECLLDGLNCGLNMDIDGALSREAWNKALAIVNGIEDELVLKEEIGEQKTPKTYQ